MGRLVLRWILLAASIVVASLVCKSLGLGFEAEVLSDPQVDARDLLELFVGTALLALLNATLRPVLKLLTLPLNCLTLGLFSLVVNALVLWLAASSELGFRITAEGIAGFGAAFVASLIISFVNAVLGMFLPDDKEK